MLSRLCAGSASEFCLQSMRPAAIGKLLHRNELTPCVYNLNQGQGLSTINAGKSRSIPSKSWQCIRGRNSPRDLYLGTRAKTPGFIVPSQPHAHARVRMRPHQTRPA